MSQPTASLANQMKMRDREMVPRFLVLAMFGLMGLSLALVTFAQLTDQPLRGVVPESAVTQSRQITLEGSRNTGVSVLDAQGTELARSDLNKSGFIDVIWVSISRARKINRIEGNPPLTLVRRENGHTAIIDPATNWSIELVGYGADNVAAFARLLD